MIEYKNEIIETLHKFQTGYRERNTDNIDRFATNMFYDSQDTIVIGTGHGEWCKGINEIKELLYIDWHYWGNFRLDIDSANICCTKDFATVTTTAYLQKAYDKEKNSSNTLSKIDKILKSDSQSDEKLFKSLKSIAYHFHEENVGSEVRRKIRFSAVLVPEGCKWKFLNIHFSYPASPPTDVKLI